MGVTESRVPEGVDLEHPNAARIYDALLGGTCNWAIDRLFAEQAVKNMPLIRTLAWCNREFLGRAVQFCARQGIRQFLDIGSGVPTAGNVHEVADEVSRDTRCVYVDIEPVAVAHATVELERNGDPKRHAVVQANMLNVDQVWEQALETGMLDPNEPIALIMVALLHFVPPEQKAHVAVERYRRLLPPDSRLIISHVTEDGVPDDLLPQIRAFVGQYEGTATPVCFRTPEEIRAFFGDFEPLDPGLVFLPAWRPGDAAPDSHTTNLANTPERACVLGGVGRKRGGN